MLSKEQMAECVEAQCRHIYGVAWDQYGEAAKDALIAAHTEDFLVALRAAEARGFKLVGREATKEMVEGWPDDPDMLPNRDDIKMAWQIMFDAAPGVRDA